MNSVREWLLIFCTGRCSQWMKICPMLWITTFLCFYSFYSIISVIMNRSLWIMKTITVPTASGYKWITMTIFSYGIDNLNNVWWSLDTLNNVQPLWNNYCTSNWTFKIAKLKTFFPHLISHYTQSIVKKEITLFIYHVHFFKKSLTPNT